jgi:gamma-glutamylcyclotransferase (GGCT)/AIG2-like uncharacterized protein YtfP
MAPPHPHFFLLSLRQGLLSILPCLVFQQTYHKSSFHFSKDKYPGPEPPFTPCNFFFYGSLMDSEVLQTILDLPSLPVYKTAFLSGLKIKMWSIYPTLIPSATYGKTQGMIWKVESAEHFSRLREYETRAYRACECEVELRDSEILRSCMTFCWAENPESQELSEGAFGLDMYQRYFKGAVVRN